MIMYFSSCLCHGMRNVTQKCDEAFACKSKFAVEDMVYQYQWFDKDTKWNNSLLHFCKFCGQDYHSIIKHINTRNGSL